MQWPCSWKDESCCWCPGSCCPGSWCPGSWCPGCWWPMFTDSTGGSIARLSLKPLHVFLNLPRSYPCISSPSNRLYSGLLFLACQGPANFRRPRFLQDDLPLLPTLFLLGPGRLLQEWGQRTHRPLCSPRRWPHSAHLVPGPSQPHTNLSPARASSQLPFQSRFVLNSQLI